MQLVRPIYGLFLTFSISIQLSHARPPETATSPSDSPRIAGATPKLNLVAIGGSNACAAAEVISGTGVFTFNNSGATMDGPAHAACHIYSTDQSQLDHDVWFCWTAPTTPCEGAYSISTCGRTSVDTRLAVYSGCGCPTNDENLLNCRDDECETQTRLLFNPIPDQQYMIRLGTYISEPGGSGTFLISCEIEPPCDEPISHCQPQDQADAFNSNRSAFAVADGFTPTQSGNINSVCWWGAYLNNTNQNCEATSTDTFRIRYFNDNSGLPDGAPIAEFSQQLGNLTLEAPFSTGLLINGVAPEYEFHATHGNLPVVAGNCYWIEITDQLTGCTWFWELGLTGDGRVMQDGNGGFPPGAYAPDDVVVGDVAFCTNIAIEHEGTSCLPPAPANDNCADATPISGPGSFFVDTAAATTDGPAHSICIGSGQGAIERDAWFRWTSTCSGDIVVHTCDDTSVDTKVAVYSSTVCPTTATNPIVCNDDLCGPDGLQSMVHFPATAGQQFLIRVGSFPQAPGGVIGVSISCGPPDNAACGSGSSNASCCVSSSDDSPGCGDELCCELVCACDPFCCNVEWDADCADHGFGDSGCGATDLCGCAGVCGNPSSGGCCIGHPPTPGCDNEACCEAVCSCDPFCCDTEWDGNCAGTGFVPGCGAELLCPSLCAASCDDDSHCPDDGLECTQNLCVGGSCQYPPVASGTPCGNQTPQGPCDRPNICNGNGACAPNFEPVTTVCRAPLSECDVTEYCSGSSANCPGNIFAVNGSPCTMDSIECTSDICQNGLCVHTPRPAGFPCGNPNPEGPCDRPDACDGNQQCDPNLRAALEVCRAAISDCDIDERCNGSSSDCPANTFQDADTTCAGDGDNCTLDHCDGLGRCVHTDQSCGACCGGPNGCVDDVLASECPEGFHPGEQCAEIKCGGIPTVSEWGLLTLALCLLSAAKIVFARPPTRMS